MCKISTYRHTRGDGIDGDGNGDGDGDGIEGGDRIKDGIGRAEERGRSERNRTIVVDVMWETEETWA